MEEWVRLSAFAYRNLIMARRNVFFLFELTFWPGVAMLSHGLLTRFLDLTPQMTAFILVGTVALSAVQVCQLDVAYAVLFDIWSKSMKHQFLTPVRIHHLALGSWVVGVGRGVIVWALMALIGGRAFGFDFLGAGGMRVAPSCWGAFDRPRHRPPRVRPRPALGHARRDLRVGGGEFLRDALRHLLPGLGAAGLGADHLGRHPAHLLPGRDPGRLRLPASLRASVRDRLRALHPLRGARPLGARRGRDPLAPHRAPPQPLE
jgi:hypothetical protein